MMSAPSVGSSRPLSSMAMMSAPKGGSMSYITSKKKRKSKGFPGGGMFASIASRVTSMFSASKTTSNPVPTDNPTTPPLPPPAPPAPTGPPPPPVPFTPPVMTRSSETTPASTDEKSTSLQQKKTSKDESLTNLIHLQLADGSFKFGQALENLIGMTEQELVEKCYKDEDSATWITAVAFATLEKIFPNDKDIWDLVANKAKLFIQKHAKNNFDEIIKIVETLINCN